MRRLIIGRDLDALAIVAAVARHAPRGRTSPTTHAARVSAPAPEPNASGARQISRAGERRARKNAKRASDARASRAGRTNT